jgi:protein-disulfide isomerase/uncharacterized membrane protein
MNQDVPEPPAPPSTATRTFDRELPAILAGVGLLLAVVLEVVHMRAYAAPGASSFCSAGARLDCNTVALSRWSIVAGVPVPVWGIAGFLALGLTAWWRSSAFLLLSGAAAAAAAGLLGIELAAVHSVCLLCEGVHVISWALFALAWRGRHSLVHTPAMTLAHLFTVPLGIVVEAYFLVTPYWALFATQHGVRLPHGVDAAGHPWIGAESAKLVVHEYVDYTCPHCAVAASHMRRLLAGHPKGMIIVRHQDPHSRCPFIPDGTHCEFVRAAGCAGEQGKFWEMDAWLFQHAPGKVTLDYGDAVRALELDGAKLTACMASEAAFSRADASAVDVYGANLFGTPAYVIDGKEYKGGEALEEVKKRL